MNELICPKCGRITDIFYNSVCRECYVRDKKLIGCPMVIHSRICPTCGSFFRKGKWVTEEDETEGILRCVKDELDIDKKARNIELAMSPEKLDNSRYRVHVEARADIEGLSIGGEVDTEVRISWETCHTCSRISGGYFEGIVQIRADKRIPTQDELKKCQDMAGEVAANSKAKGDRLAFIAEIHTLPEGIDLYVGSAKLGKQICRALADTFGGGFRESPKLVGQKNGIDLYRITYAMRLPEFVRGDIISVDDRVIEVKNCGKHINGIDLETGKRFVENYSDLMEVKKLGSIRDVVPAVLVADEGSTIQVMDPDTYESVTIRRPEFLGVEPGNEVKIIKTMKRIYVVP